MTSLLRRAARLLTPVAAVTVVLLGPAAPAQAHPLSTSAVLLDIGDDAVTATVQLPLDELSVALDRTLTAESVLRASTSSSLRTYVRAHLTGSDSGGRSWSTAVSGGRVEKVDGIDNLVLDATLAPASGSVGDFVLHDDVVIDLLQSHRVFVSARYGDSGPYTTLAMLSWQRTSVPVAAATPATGSGFLPAVRLGVSHIAGGSDHLLFLIMLLLPAPLSAIGRRWRRRSDSGLIDARRSTIRVVHVVTAFAVGHSCTLVLGALGWVSLPTGVIESGIALSVLVSAVHAIRPLVRRGELLIAGGFGLLHGLSFAAVLGELDLSSSSLVVTLLGFNIGVELAQLIVVALVMPSLILLSRTPVYGPLRIGLAAIGSVLAAGWFADRVGLIAGNPLEPVGELLVEAPVVLALGLAVLAAVMTVTRRARRPGTGECPTPVAPRASPTSIEHA